MLFLVVSAVPGPLILRTWPATVTAALYFAAGWIAFRFLGAWDPHAYKVFRRARQYRNRQTATLFARASWRSPVHRFVVRRH
jgi:type IV secretory pathway TrbD component